MLQPIADQIAALQAVLAHYPLPTTQDEVLCLTTQALRQALGPIRCLFYLAEIPPDIELSYLLRCPARSLAPDLFVSDPTHQSDHFTLTTEHPTCAPLLVAGRPLGCLFVEPSQPGPLNEAEQSLVALVATHTARQLYYLEQSRPMSNPVQHDRGLLIIDEVRSWVWIGSVPLRLSRLELALLDLLYRHPGRPCSRELICQTIYAEDSTASDSREDRLDTLIYRLRAKLKRVAPIRL